MGETVVYEIGRYDGWEGDAELIDRIQLVSVGSVLILSDSVGNDSLCEGAMSSRCSHPCRPYVIFGKDRKRELQTAEARPVVP